MSPATALPAPTPPPETGWQSRPTLFFALGLVLLLLAWAGTCHRIRVERELLESSADKLHRSITVIVAENLSQVVDRGRLMAASASGWLAGERANNQHQLGQMLAADQVYLRYALYDHDMRLLLQSSPRTAHQDWRPALQATALRMPHDDLGAVEVVKPTQADEHAWELPLLFRVGSPQGQAQGYLLLSLDMGYLLSLYRNVELGRTGAIQVLGHDGTVLAEARGQGMSVPEPGAPIPSGRLWTDGMQSGTLDLRGDGRLRVVAMQSVGPTPLLVAVSRELEDVLQEHRRSNRAIWSVLGTLTLILLASGEGMRRGLQRQRAFIQALHRTDAEKQELIALLEQEKGRALTLAAYDHLTGLHNRRMFTELASSHLAAARRSPKHYALLYFDLDRFKPINDSLGHHVGDLLLQAVATRLRQHTRAGDLSGRMGGDEFALLVTGLDKPADIEVIAAKLVHELSRPYTELDGHDVHVTPSVGIAVFPRDGHDVNTLCRNADAAMYQSKRAGRGLFTCYSAGFHPSGDRFYVLERHLPRALAEDELVLHFQPKVRLSDLRIVGMEALVRWQHPEFGLVLPGDFIPMAEQAGLIAPLTQWVMRACCRQLVAWREAGVPVVPVALNVAPQQLQDESLPAHLQALLDEHGLNAADLEIEITEGSLVEPVEVASRVLHALDHMGMAIALDDFGTGFSSLGQIRQFPISKLKIDKSFVNDLRSSKDVGVIVTSIITLAHNLDMTVVAEGVELLDQLVYLKTAGCDEVQGYYLGRPLPASGAARLLHQTHLMPE